jgi:hypothetical protein
MPKAKPKEEQFSATATFLQGAKYVVGRCLIHNAHLGKNFKVLPKF